MRSIPWLVFLVGCSDFAIHQVKEPVAGGDGVLDVSPGILDYGTLGSPAAVTDTVTITSVGDVPVTISSLAMSGSSAFQYTWPEGTLTLAPDESTDVVVTYTPASADDEGQLVVHSDALLPTDTVDLRGAGTYPALLIDPPEVSFQSDYGEPVYATVHVTSVGTADLDLSDMVVQGGEFAATDPDIPVVLPPGESTDITVEYTPLVAGESVSGKIWLTTNTAEGFAIVPLEGHEGPVCLGLGEAWDRGLLDPHTGVGGLGFQVKNLSTDQELCIDNWYVYLSDDSQDLGAGDMDADFGDVYPAGSITLSPGEAELFDAAAYSGSSWWCMEHTQYTQGNASYEFLGARVPEPLLSSMLAADQDAVWAWMDANPVMIAARKTNYVEVSKDGGSAPVTLRILNMGSQPGTAEVRETVQAGFTASDFSVAPTRTEVGPDGGSVYVFTVSLNARTVTGDYEPTVYDDQLITYTLTTSACLGRQYEVPMETLWSDSGGTTRTDTANPLVVNCL